MLKNKILGAVAVAATLLASIAATSACFWFIYQPEEPECLSKESAFRLIPLQDELNSWTRKRGTAAFASQGLRRFFYYAFPDWIITACYHIHLKKGPFYD